MSPQPQPGAGRPDVPAGTGRWWPVAGSWRPGAWLVVLAAVAYVLAATWGSWTPQPGVRYVEVWLAGAAGAIAAVVLLRVAAGRTAGRGGTPGRAWLRPVEVLAIAAVVAMLITDWRVETSQGLRDLGIYLKAGQHYLDGTPVYLQAPMTGRPDDLTNFPFLYPPLTLPFFALLSMIPEPFVAIVWVGGSAVLVALALRLMGVPTRWLALFAIFPPLFQGLFVGNVAVASLVLFAAAPWIGAGLVLGAVFKTYTGIASLWLVRERRWAQLALGVAALLALAVATLPLTGSGLWSEWLSGLRLYQESQPLVPSLYGFGLPRYVPFAVYAVLAAGAILLALRPAGREGLARLGTATVVASPSLFGHGLLVALPSLLSLRALWLWAGLALMAVPDGLQSWPAVALVVASWLVPVMRRSTLPAGAPNEPLHPLGPAREPWPSPGERAPQPLSRPALTPQGVPTPRRGWR